MVAEIFMQVILRREHSPTFLEAFAVFPGYSTAMESPGSSDRPTNYITLMIHTFTGVAHSFQPMQVRPSIRVVCLACLPSAVAAAKESCVLMQASEPSVYYNRITD